MKEVFESEISAEDLDNQVLDFLSYDDYTVINDERQDFTMDGFIVHIARLTYEYEYNYSLNEVVDLIQINILQNQN